MVLKTPSQKINSVHFCALVNVNVNILVLRLGLFIFSAVGGANANTSQNIPMFFMVFMRQDHR